MKMLWLIIVIVLLGAGCLGYNGKVQYVRQEYKASVPEMVLMVYVDKNFGEADCVSIQEAMDQWNYALNGYLVLKIGERLDEIGIVNKVMSGGIGIIKINTVDLRGFDKSLWDHEIVIRGKKVPAYTLGFADRVGGRLIYLVRDRLGNKDVKPLTMHEMGHALGSDHVGSGLMTPLYDGEWQCVDRATMEQVAVYWKLPAEKMNWCYRGDDPFN